MKKIHLLLLSVTLCLFSACHNDIWDAIDGLDSRVTKLEELCKEMNTNITSLQTIVDVLQSNDFITGVVEIKKDGEVIGYTITFGKHDPITIYHGQDGKDGQDGANGSSSTPVIGVAQDTDGVYYWTLNGEWLLDDNGNRLPVSGTNGKDGAIPQLKIEEGYWYVSYDNGITWTQLGNATGEDGEKGEQGESGDSMFQSVTQDENYVYFTLADGTVIKIEKSHGSALNDSTTHQGYKFVDLGLSVKWATTNVGAKLTGDIGTLYPCPNSLAGGEDYAAKERGGSWRTPTVAEIQELIDSCSVELKQYVNSDGKIVYGFNFKGKTGHSIYLPFEDYTYFSIDLLSAYQYYWSSNINITDEKIIGRGLSISVSVNEGYYDGKIGRSFKKELVNITKEKLCPIRPVCE